MTFNPFRRAWCLAIKSHPDFSLWTDNTRNWTVQIPLCLFILKFYIPKDISSSIVNLILILSKPPSIYPLLIRFKKYKYNDDRSQRIQKVDSPHSIVIGEKGTMLVSQSKSVAVYSQEGEYIRTLPGFSNSCAGLAVDKNFNIYVCNKFKRVIDIYNCRYTYVDTIRLFNPPECVAISKTGNILVGMSNSPVVVFSSKGAFIFEFGKTMNRSPGYFDSFEMVSGIAVDNEDNIFVSDRRDGIRIFNSEGLFLYNFGVGQIHRPNGLIVDRFGNIAVSDNLRRIVVFSPDGSVVQTFGELEDGDPVRGPYVGLAVDSFGNFYAVDGKEICIFS